jgi:hypothetical protein
LSPSASRLPFRSKSSIGKTPTVAIKKIDDRIVGFSCPLVVPRERGQEGPVNDGCTLGKR